MTMCLGVATIIIACSLLCSYLLISWSSYNTPPNIESSMPDGIYRILFVNSENSEITIWSDNDMCLIYDLIPMFKNTHVRQIHTDSISITKNEEQLTIRKINQ